MATDASKMARGNMIAKQAARNVVAWKQRYQETGDVDFLYAVKGSVECLVMRAEKQKMAQGLLDTLVSRGVIRGYNIDPFDGDPYGVNLTPREVTLFNLDPKTVNWNALKADKERLRAIHNPSGSLAG